MKELAFTVKSLTWLDTWNPSETASSPDGQIGFEPDKEYRIPFLNDDVLDVSSLVIDPLVVKTKDLLELAVAGTLRVL